MFSFNLIWNRLLFLEYWWIWYLGSEPPKQDEVGSETQEDLDARVQRLMAAQEQRILILKQATTTKASRWWAFDGYYDIYTPSK